MAPQPATQGAKGKEAKGKGAKGKAPTGKGSTGKGSTGKGSTGKAANSEDSGEDSGEEGKQWRQEKTVKQKARSKAVTRSKPGYKLEWEAEVKEVSQERWRSYRSVGIELGRKTIDRDAYSHPKLPFHYPELKDEPGSVWALLKSDGQVGFKIKLDKDKGEPGMWTSITKVNYSPGISMQDLLPRLVQLRAQAKALEQSENSPSLATRLTKIEAELAVQFKQCRHKAVEFVTYLNLLEPDTGDEYNWPASEQDKGLELFKKLVDAHGNEYFTSPEVTSIAARFLQANLRALPQWFRDETRYWDFYLWMVHEHVFIRFGSMRRRARAETTNLPLLRKATEFLEEQDKFKKRMVFHNFNAVANVVRNSGHLAVLAGISPIAVEAINAQPTEETPDPSLMLNKPKSHLYRHPGFYDWIDFYYSPGGMIPRFPLCVGPEVYINPRLNLSQTHQYARQALRDAVAELTEYAEWELVCMVFRDFMVPAADAGRADKVVRLHKQLMTAIGGRVPPDREDEYYDRQADPTTDDSGYGHGDRGNGNAASST